MAEIKGTGLIITANVSFTLSEKEAKALHDLVGYGNEDILKALSNNLSAGIVHDNQEGFVTLFNSLRDLLPPILSPIKEARKVVSDHFAKK